MEIVYHQGKRPNFGDDLNADIWHQLFPPEALAAEGAVLIGIGSILTEQRLSRYTHHRGRVIVLGTGTSYGSAPAGIGGWDVLAVRGPLTASLIGMPAKAVTDGAILLSTLTPEQSEPARSGDIVFIPHRRSIRQANWKSIAASAGMVYVSPEQPASRVIESIRKARLVVTEAMHGAIVADTYRVPWIPLAISPAIDEFKWRDWTLSMGLPFNPQTVPAGHPTAEMEDRQVAATLSRAGMMGHDHLDGIIDGEELMEFLERRFSPQLKAAVNSAQPSRLVRAIRAPAGWLDQKCAASAVTALSKAASSTQYLSRDDVFLEKQAMMCEAVDGARRILLNR